MSSLHFRSVACVSVPAAWNSAHATLEMQQREKGKAGSSPLPNTRMNQTGAPRRPTSAWRLSVASKNDVFLLLVFLIRIVSV